MKIDSILKKALDGKRLTEDEGVALFGYDDLLLLGSAARSLSDIRSRKGIITYIIDRNINYTNICVSRCKFCAFYRNAVDNDAYVLDWGRFSEKIKETIAFQGRQILLQGGLHPELSFDYYTGLLKKIKKNFDIHVHAFSPPEIVYFSNKYGLSIKEVIYRLKSAGLDSIPGGGAEILVDRIRKKISPDKCNSKEWLTVMEEAHHLNLKTTATMMFGHLESYRDRVKHLIKIRTLQDKTAGFTAFIPWSFQPNNTKLQGSTKISFGFDYLKTVAISRLMLDNFKNIQSSWVTQGPKVGQLAIFFGANDLGSIMIEENVVRSAGVSYNLSEEEIKDLILSLSLIPQRRNLFYDYI